ncbi:MAG: STAS domain-containing protein [Deltaproteobacteria bacterium]|jgi:anti-anti-sigma factor|nr:STAS domain-containing protein [Deltaproteobacteria bacterium]
MNIAVNEENGVRILSVSGRMDATNSADFDQAAKELLGTAPSRILLDLSRLEFISSAGLRVVLILGKACQEHSLTLAFCDLQPMVAEIFSISSFDAIFKIFPTKEEALKNL